MHSWKSEQQCCFARALSWFAQSHEDTKMLGMPEKPLLSLAGAFDITGIVMALHAGNGPLVALWLCAKISEHCGIASFALIKTMA